MVGPPQQSLRVRNTTVYEICLNKTALAAKDICFVKVWM